MKQKCQDLRQQQESLKGLKEKLDRLQKVGGAAEKKELQLREARVEFDRYMRRFIADGKRRRKAKPTMDEKIATFRSKWAAYLEDGQSVADDLRPVLGLDACEPRPIFTSYEVEGILGRNRASANLMFDREVQKMKSNRDKVSGFFREQQRWLADLKSDLDSGFAGVPAVRKTSAAVPQSINFYPQARVGMSDHSLVALRNSLSDLIK